MRYFLTTNKKGDTVRVDEEFANKLVESGKKTWDDLEPYEDQTKVKEYTTTTKDGRSVKVDEEFANKLVESGKKTWDDLEPVIESSGRTEDIEEPDKPIWEEPEVFFPRTVATIQEQRQQQVPTEVPQSANEARLRGMQSQYDLGRLGAGIVGDVASLPFRALETMAKEAFGYGDTDQTMSERMAQVDTGSDIADIVRSPANVLMFAPGMRALGAAGEAGGRALAEFIPGILGRGATKVLPTVAEQAALQAPYTAMTALEKTARGQDVSLEDMASEQALGTGLGSLLGLGGKAISKYFKPAVEKTGEVVTEGLGTVLESTTKTPKRVLKFVGTGEIENKLKKVKNVLSPGSDINVNDKIDYIKDYVQVANDAVTNTRSVINRRINQSFNEIRPEVDNVLDMIGEISVEPIVKKINKDKLKLLNMDENTGLLPLGYGYSSDRKLLPLGDITENAIVRDPNIKQKLKAYDNALAKITGTDVGIVPTEVVTARDLYNIRQKLDEAIPFSRERFATGVAEDVVNIPKKIRNDVSNLLKEKSDETILRMGDDGEMISSYKELMKDYTDLYDLRSAVKKTMGYKDNDIEKSVKFLSSLSDESANIDQVNLARKIHDVIGVNVKDTRRGGLIDIAKHYDKGLKLLTKDATLSPTGAVIGGSALAFNPALLGLAGITSPKLAAPVLGLSEAAAKAAGSATGTLGDLVGSRPATGLVRTAISERYEGQSPLNNLLR